MKRNLAILLQIIIVLVGVGALALMLWEPQLEGRNADATLYQIYFNDPFLAYAYTASLALFTALYQAFKLAGYLGKNNLSSPAAVKALRIIKYCGISLMAALGAALLYLFVAVRGQDDIAGGVAIGLVLMLVSVVIVAAAAVGEKRLRT